MTIIREFAPAKINLTLEVLGKRADGYHELKSLVAFADVGDWITLDTSKPIGVTVSGAFGQTFAGANLVETTLRLIEQAAPDLQLGAVHLEKNLPVAAGIGGGSADAAAVIRAAQRANPERAASVDWQTIALRLGADVPVCLVSRFAWMTGLGETVEAVSRHGTAPFCAIIVNPLVPVPADKTAQVFRALDAKLLPPEFVRLPPPTGQANSAGPLTIVRDGSNALAPAAQRIVPEIAAVLGALANLEGCRLARMSGAGPTVFAVFDDAASATSAAEMLRRAHPTWWVRATTLS